jgi:carboxyl-terminal processing protease
MKHLIFSILFSIITIPSFASTLKAQTIDVNFYNEIKNGVKQVYVDEINEEDFIYNSLNGGLTGLDPHSGYLKPDEYEKFKESVSGEFSGIGVQIIPEGGFIKVIAPIDDTPAFNAGIKAGDFITHINGENTYQISVEEASSKMRGKEGTKLKLVILRAGVSEPIELELKREKIKNKSVSVKSFNDILIVRISSFITTTADELKAELAKYNDPKGIILDLRNNPGGVLEQAIIISNFFLPKDTTIVSVKTKNSAPNELKTIKLNCQKGAKNCEEVLFQQKENESFFYSTANTLIDAKIPLIVLINSGSASASEIVAGALKDNKRAKIIGEVSFGKGVVQSIFPINEGKNGAMKITISRYYSPSGASIQTAGITPDITILNGRVEIKESKLQSLFSQRESDLKNHTTGERLEEIARQSEKYSKSKEGIKAYYEDFQLLTAINIMQAISN